MYSHGEANAKGDKTYKMYHYTKEGARTLPVWRTSNIFMDSHCVCPFSRVSGTLAGHI